jgi:hypothetical protein
MKQLAFVVIAAFAGSLWAQAPAKPEPVKEAPKPEPVMKEPAKRAAAAPGKPRRWNEDARHCLEKTSNTEVIKCAEEFL